jgi:hypothetical protein
MPKVNAGGGAHRVHVSAAPPEPLPSPPIELVADGEEHHETFFADCAAQAHHCGLADPETGVPKYGNVGNRPDWAQTERAVADDGALGISATELHVRGAWATAMWMQCKAAHNTAEDGERCFRGVVVARPVLLVSGAAQALLADVDGFVVVLQVPKPLIKGIPLLRGSIAVRAKPYLVFSHFCRLPGHAAGLLCNSKILCGCMQDVGILKRSRFAAAYGWRSVTG